MKRLVLPAAALTAIGALASCTHTPENANTAPVTETPAQEQQSTVTPTDTDASSASTNTGTTAEAGTGASATGAADASVSMTTTSDVTATATGASATGQTTGVVMPDSDMAVTQPVATTSTPAPTAMVAESAVHSKTVTYTTPGGPDDVEFSVTVSGGKITAVSVTPKADHDVSKMLQGKFRDAVAAEVVGKDIKDLNLKAVGGASLTTGAFVQFVNSF